MRKVFLALMGLMLLASTAFGAVAVNENGTYVGEVVTLDFPPNTVSTDGSTLTIGAEGKVEFLLRDFLLVSDTTVTPLSESTRPGLEVTPSEITALVWDDGGRSPIAVTFRVPADYASGGAFRVFTDEGMVADTTTCYVDYIVHVNRTGIKWNQTSDNQVAIALPDDPYTPSLVNLPVVTTFASLAAGDMVTLELWRDDVATGTRELFLYYAEFYYSRN